MPQDGEVASYVSSEMPIPHNEAAPEVVCCGVVLA